MNLARIYPVAQSSLGEVDLVLPRGDVIKIRHFFLHHVGCVFRLYDMQKGIVFVTLKRCSQGEQP